MCMDTDTNVYKKMFYCLFVVVVFLLAHTEKEKIASLYDFMLRPKGT